MRLSLLSIIYLCTIPTLLHTQRASRHTKVAPVAQAAALPVHTSAPTIPHTNAPAPCYVYVLLDTYSLGISDTQELSIETNQQGFALQDAYRLHPAEVITEPSLLMTLYADRIQYKTKSCRHELCITPHHSSSCAASPSEVAFCAYKGHRYQGALLLLREGSTWYVVNKVELEDYVYAVLGHESWPGWPLEINKAFAIVFRSYALAKRNQARQKTRFLFDIRSTNVHQTYKGLHAHTSLREAVDQTQYMVLTHEQKPILAMYDTCCGGVIPTHMKGKDFSKTPYLARDYACTFCQQCTAYTWQTSYSLEELGSLLKTVDTRLSRITHITIAEKDAAGVVHTLSVKTRTRTVQLPRRTLHSICKNIKSPCFSVRRSGSRIIFEGKGLGHLMGLCQWGARQMIRLKKSYDETLYYFYPGTQIKRFTLQ